MEFIFNGKRYREVPEVTQEEKAIAELKGKLCEMQKDYGLCREVFRNPSADEWYLPEIGSLKEKIQQAEKDMRCKSAWCGDYEGDPIIDAAIRDALPPAAYFVMVCNMSEAQPELSNCYDAVSEQDLMMKIIFLQQKLSEIARDPKVAQQLKEFRAKQNDGIIQ